MPGYTARFPSSWSAAALPFNAAQNPQPSDHEPLMCWFLNPPIQQPATDCRARWLGEAVSDYLDLIEAERPLHLHRPITEPKIPTPNTTTLSGWLSHRKKAEKSTTHDGKQRLTSAIPRSRSGTYKLSGLLAGLILDELFNAAILSA